MPFRAAALSAVAAVCLAAAAPADAADDCHLKQVASLPTTIAADGRMLIDAGINGETVKLLLNTGAVRSLLAPDFVKSRNMPWNEDTGTRGYGLTGKSLTGWTRVSLLTLGNVVARNQNFSFGSVGGDGGPVGLLANDFLEANDVEIDPAAARVNLFSPDHCTGKVVYWAKEYSRLPLYLTGSHRPEVEIKIGGETLHALIDTGTAATTMRLAVARRLFGVDPGTTDPRTHTQVAGVDGVRIDSFPHGFDSLTFGDITLRNPVIQIADIDSAKGAVNNGSHMTGSVDQPDVLIGMSLLRQLHLFIAYSEPALYYTLAQPTRTD
jgi:predicted aspartyl protease